MKITNVITTRDHDGKIISQTAIDYGDTMQWEQEPWPWTNRTHREMAVDLPIIDASTGLPLPVTVSVKTIIQHFDLPDWTPDV